MLQIGHVTHETSVVGGVFTSKHSRVEPSAVEGASDERLGSSQKVEALNEVEVSNDGETDNYAANNAANTLVHLSCEDDTVTDNQSIEESMKNNVEKENEKELEKENEKETEKENEKETEKENEKESEKEN